MPPFPHRRLARRPMKPRLAGLVALWPCLALLLMLASPAAKAIPAFARQTGSTCADCHVGAYGPDLTPYGMQFKLNGFTDTDGNGVKIPVAVQLTGTRTVPASGMDSNRLTEADLYLAGRIDDHVGGFVKVGNYNNGRNRFVTKLANVDLRYVSKTFKLGGKDAMLGVSVNNNPGISDPIGSLPNTNPGVLGVASSYAYSTTLLNMSSLSDKVIGASVYGVYDSDWYGEVGTYNSLPLSEQDHLGYGIGGDPGKLQDTGYLRFAYMKDLKRQFFSAGIVALTTKRRLPRNGPRDAITDLGYDLSYQFLGTGVHTLQLGFVNIYERRRYGGIGPGPANPSLLTRPHGSIRDRNMNLTYVFRQSYGLTLAHMTNTGSTDAARYTPYGVPDTTSNLITVFWTPFGKDDSFTSIANMKIAANWFRFTRFNGSTRDITGTLPPVTNPHDLDAFLVSVSLAF